MSSFMAAAAIVSMAWNVNLEQSVNNEKILYQEASAEETESLEDLLIEDDGEVTVNKSGVDLEELIAAERESEEQARMQMEELLRDFDFIRINRHSLVSFNKIMRISHNEIILKKEKQLHIGKTYQKMIRALIRQRSI